MSKPSPVDEIFDRLIGDIDDALYDTWTGKPDNSSQHNATKAKVQAKTQLHKLILDELPKKCEVPTNDNDKELLVGTGFCRGHNSALSDVRQSLNDLFVDPKPSKRPKV